MNEYKLKKFPVVSSAGNEYLVVIEPSGIFDNTSVVEVISVVTKRGLFGRERKSRQSYGNYLYDEKSYEYDYVTMAKESVEKVEAYIKEKREETEMQTKAIREFEKWDGKGGDIE